MFCGVTTLKSTMFLIFASASHLWAKVCLKFDTISLDSQTLYGPSQPLITEVPFEDNILKLDEISLTSCKRRSRAVYKQNSLYHIQPPLRVGYVVAHFMKAKWFLSKISLRVHLETQYSNINISEQYSPFDKVSDSEPHFLHQNNIYLIYGKLLRKNDYLSFFPLFFFSFLLHYFNSPFCSVSTLFVILIEIRSLLPLIAVVGRQLCACAQGRVAQRCSAAIKKLKMNRSFTFRASCKMIKKWASGMPAKRVALFHTLPITGFRELNK